MKIAIHCGPNEGSPGGAEFSVATLAHAFSREHDVRILHHRPELTGAQLGTMAGLDLSRVDTVYAPLPPANAWSCNTASSPRVRFKGAREWQADLSRGMDVFVTFTHGVPPFCHARRGVLIVLFPMFERRALWPWVDDGSTPVWKRLTRRGYYEWEWKQRMSSYGNKIAISEFARDWSRRWWGIRTSVVHPPVDTWFPNTPKDNSILSIGRFATAGVPKKQLEMVNLFNRVQASLPGWSYVSAGTLGDSEADAAYFERVRREASGSCHVEPNLPRPELRRMLAASKIFWHGAGFGEAEGKRPEMSEHFGIATVEAMAAGSIPVVVNTGGQREIVTHGIDGFLWNSLEECERFTIQIARDHALRLRMSARARSRAEAFNTAVFIRKIEAVVQPMDNTRGTRHAASVAESVTSTH